MHISSQTVVIIVALLIVLVLLLALTGRRRRRHTRRMHRGEPTKHAPAKKRDYGAETAARHGHARSPEWPRVEREHRLREPACVACGYTGHGIQVHHIKPFHLHPQLELDPNNLITLCEVSGRDHHLLLGHLDDWESYNVNVRDDVKHFHNKTADQIRADPTWQKKVKQRPLK
jgi:HNH endonuclease